MTAVAERQQQQEAYFSAFSQLEKRWAAEPAFPFQERLRRLRSEALERFGELGFPGTRLEDWKYTNVATLAKIPFQPAPARKSAAISEAVRNLLPGWRHLLVFVNGRYAAELSSVDALPAGVTAGSLAGAMKEDAAVAEHLARHAAFDQQAFVALNTAFVEDGAFIHIAKGIVLEEPLYVLYVSTSDAEPRVSHPRTLVLADRECQASIVEGYFGPEEPAGDGPYFTNAVSEVVLEESAIVEHYKIQQESDGAFHVAALQLQQARSSSLTSHSVSLGGALVRNDINAVLEGEGAECLLNGLYVARGEQHVDNHTLIDHAKPHCNSRELYKGILDGRASGVFNGGIIVRKDAQKTDAKQSNKNLLLSEHAVINTKPQLQIWADDVRCTHGATIGQIDQEAVFYLRSRGLDLATARSLLTFAFTNELLLRMKVESLRAPLSAMLLARLT